MFIDELTIHAKAGNGGRGVVRWLKEKWKPLGGPAGGNGGNGGDVYIRGVRDTGLLSSYTGTKLFAAGNGEDGGGRSQHGRAGEDCVIDLPVGSVVTNTQTGEQYELLFEGDCKKVLRGGRGGLGNEHFKSSVNRSPEESTRGREGEGADFYVELELVVDVGIIGLPNAGKSSLLNALTNATSRVGSYPFTTLKPHLGDLYGFTLADIPGLIEGASAGKGLGHTFLRHVRRTKMLLHCVPCDAPDPLAAYQSVRAELLAYDARMGVKEEWVVLTKSDTVSNEECERVQKIFHNVRTEVHAVSILDDTSVKHFSDLLVRALRAGENSATISSHEQ